MSRKLNKMSDHHKPSIHIQERTGSVQLCKDFPHQMESLLSGCHGISPPLSCSRALPLLPEAVIVAGPKLLGVSSTGIAQLRPTMFCHAARAAALGLWHPGLACCQIITVQNPITISLVTPTLIAPDIASCMQLSWISLHIDN